VGFFFYELPLWVSLPSFVLGVLVISWGILLLVRPWVQRTAATNPEWDRILGYAMSSYGIFYGILLALVAVSVYENFQRVDNVVLEEVSALATFYRAVSDYPAPYDSELQEQLLLYTEGVITIDWPSQAQGIVPNEGYEQVDAIQSVLFRFEPQDLGEQAYHEQTLALFFDVAETRRDRLDETGLALPVLLWVVIAIGGVLNALMISLIEARNLRIHLIMSGIIAIFVALLVFVTASLDHPYAGPVSVDPEGYSVLLDQLIVGRG
jgi:hypothetical protein